MRLWEVLKERKGRIAAKWFEQVVATYPEETAKFLKSKRDPFSNPVGNTIKEGIEGIINSLLDKGEEVNTFLDRIIRIRAVQDFTPSEAVSFVFQLKDVVREELADMSDESWLTEEIPLFDRRVDELALKAFDIFMNCRERLYEIKVDEMRNWTFRLLERANLLEEFERKKKNL